MNIGVLVGDETVYLLPYADDIVLLADSVDNLQSLLDESIYGVNLTVCVLMRVRQKLYIFVCGLQLLEHVIYLNAGISY